MLAASFSVLLGFLAFSGDVVHEMIVGAVLRGLDGVVTVEFAFLAGAVRAAAAVDPDHFRVSMYLSAAIAFLVKLLFFHQFQSATPIIMPVVTMVSTCSFSMGRTAWPALDNS